MCSANNNYQVDDVLVKYLSLYFIIRTERLDCFGIYEELTIVYWKKAIAFFVE